MRCWLGPAAAALLLGCPSTPAPPREAHATNLRVPLPDGWRAQSSQGALLVGPPGSPVLQLESLSRDLPALEQLTAPLKRERVVVLSKESTDDLRVVRYRLGDGEEAFLAVHRLGARTVWCATLKGAKGEALGQALAVCKGLGAHDGGADEGG